MIIQKTIKNEFKAMDLWVTRCAIFIVFGIVVFFIKKNLAVLIAFTGIPIVLGLPVFYLQIEYLIYNKTQKIIPRYETKEFEVYFKSNTELYSFGDIDKIVIYACPNFYDKGVRYMFWEDHHFAIIYLKNNSRIIITCFMGSPLSNFAQQFDGIQIRLKKTFFPSIILKKLSW